MSLLITNKQLSYRTLRALQISTVFTFTIFLIELLRFPHAGWTGFAVMMIYAGFDNGTTLFRAYHRFLGVLLGLLSGYGLWFIGHLDYRLLILIFPVTIYLAYFLVGQAYSIPTVFTVNTSIIGTGYFDLQETFSLSFFLVDYFFCTVIAFAIILVFEHFWFSRYSMMNRFIYDTQIEALTALNHLVSLLEQDKIHRKTWFSGCLKLTSHLFEMSNLIQNNQFLMRSKQAVGDEFSEFNELANKSFVGIKALYLAHHTKRHRKYDYLQLRSEVHEAVRRLSLLVAQHPSYPSSRIFHEALD
jgi:uncharacterized membrane protein YccC